MAGKYWAGICYGFRSTLGQLSHLVLALFFAVSLMRLPTMKKSVEVYSDIDV